MARIPTCFPSDYILIRLIFFATLFQSSFAAQNFVVPWSIKRFGPDGPWQAVTITVGGNDPSLYLSNQQTSQVTVYPGGEWDTLAFASEACEGLSDPQCGSGGFWDPAPDVDQDISVPGQWRDNATGINVQGATIYASGLTIGQKTVWNATLSRATSGNVTYPNGNVGGMTLGRLSLGAPDLKQFFSLSDKVGDGVNASLFAGQLYEDREIPSYSYGLHIGSASFDYPGSLVFGGYNKGRVIAPVTSFSGDEQTIDLIDIGIGVEYGDSPFDFAIKDQLLSSGQTKTSINPLAPYLSLPGETCDKIAKLLPVNFDQSSKYYVWDTEDARFAQIVSSPAYLSFTFPPAPGDGDNVIIKVPFALLNLTLDKPIVDTPTQYFPCVPYEEGPILGRAFLQAAFIGRNWSKKISWLAQAPGPGIARDGLRENNQDIPDGGTMIEGYSGSELFNESWAGHWSIIASQERPAPKDIDTEQIPSDRSSENSLSTGAKAGIGIGAAIGALVVVGATVFLWRRHASKNKATEIYTNVNGQPSPAGPVEKWHHHQSGQDEWGRNHGPTLEMATHSNSSPVEAPDTSSSANRY